VDEDEDPSVSEDSQVVEESKEYQEPGSSFFVDFIDNYDEDTHYDVYDHDSSSGDEYSNHGSPTVRNPAHRNTITEPHTYRDSITTIKAESYTDISPEETRPSHITALSGDGHTRSIPKLSLSIPSTKSSAPLPTQTQPTPGSNSQGQTPSSGQVVEVPMLHGRVQAAMPQFTLVMFDAYVVLSAKVLFLLS